MVARRKAQCISPLRRSVASLYERKLEEGECSVSCMLTRLIGCPPLEEGRWGRLPSAGGLAFLTCQSKHSEKLHSLRGEQQLTPAVLPAFILHPHTPTPPHTALPFLYVHSCHFADPLCSHFFITCCRPFSLVFFCPLQKWASLLNTWLSFVLMLWLRGLTETCVVFSILSRLYHSR